MKLELFDFIDGTITLFEENLKNYGDACLLLQSLFQEILETRNDCFVGLRTRIKTTDSLKEKLIRNRFYIDYLTPEDALRHLSDVIGITAQCRFQKNEEELYRLLFGFFDNDDLGYAQCSLNPDVYMNRRMRQPQVQRNGFTIYRVDGYCIFNGKRVNYELQIKSLVHAFWSEIEHEVVYKNPEFVVQERFNRRMLAAIRENLDVVDEQLEIMYEQISEESASSKVGMDEISFKTLFSRSINELVNQKMRESLGFTTDFKKCSAVLTQYIYVKDFVNGENNGEKMIEYMKLMNMLSQSNIDFSLRVDMEESFHSPDPFCNMIGRYFESRMNVDFQWHVLFMMVFLINGGSHIEAFTSFVEVIRLLLIQPRWYEERFMNFAAAHASEAKEHLALTLAEALCDIGKIDIIHEDKLYHCMEEFRSFIEKLEERYKDYPSFYRDMPRITNALLHQVTIIFQ